MGKNIRRTLKESIRIITHFSMASSFGTEDQDEKRITLVFNKRKH